MKISDKQINGVVFDMDGVLYDTEKIGLASWKIVGEEYGLEDIDTVARRCIGRSTADTAEIIMQAYGKNLPMEKLYRQTSEIQRKIIAEKGLPIKKGAVLLLEYLKSEGVKIGLASSTSYKGVMRNLEQTDMSKYFAEIVGGDMILHSKPQPEIYLLACEKLAINPENAIAVEDSINGIISSYRAGMIPFLVPDIVEPTEEILKMAHKKFGDLLEVRDYIANISTSNTCKV